MASKKTTKKQTPETFGKKVMETAVKLKQLRDRQTVIMKEEDTLYSQISKLEIELEKLVGLYL
jgi:hypothetical protein